MFLIIGTKFFTRGKDKTPDAIRCPICGRLNRFIEKTRRRFLTLFFVIPTIPLGGRKRLIECPNCRARIKMD